MKSLKICTISDTHTLHRAINIPAADIIIHCGDFSNRGNIKEVRAFIEWFGGLSHKHKIMICGNHELELEDDTIRNHYIAYAKTFGINFLHNSGVCLEGLNFWGSPFTPEFCSWGFGYKREAGASIWTKIPKNTDVLVTHGPPLNILDNTKNGPQGCENLFEAVKAINPKIHCFGHIHEGYGLKKINKTWFINSAICTRLYRPTNLPIVKEIKYA